MFVTGRIHHIPDAATCLAGLFLLTITGVINGTEIGTGISWDLVIFIGVAMSFGAVFADTGISKWLVGVLVPVIQPLTASPWLFAYSMAILFFVIRFFDVAVFIPTMSILVPIIPEISKSFGIDPLVWTAIFVMACNCFFLSYTNMFAMVAESLAKERSWTSPQITRYGLVYFVACLITLAVAIPYWTSMGMFH
jgi:di/tricarboxylate transporter